METTPTSANTERYIQIVRQRVTDRALLKLGQEIQYRIKTPPDGLDLVVWTEQEVSAIQARCAGVANEPQPLSDLARRIADEVLNQPSREYIGLKIGMADGALDDLVAMEPGKLIVPGGRTSMGKSTFALHLARSIFQNNPYAGFPLIVSTEMAQFAMARASLASAASLPIRELAKRNFTVS